jgi:hypothetical protein
MGLISGPALTLTRTRTQSGTKLSLPDHWPLNRTLEGTRREPEHGRSVASNASYLSRVVAEVAVTAEAAEVERWSAV